MMWNFLLLLTYQAMNWSRHMMAVQGVKTQVILFIMVSLPNFRVSNDHKFNSMPQCHSQAAVLSQAQVHAGAETKEIVSSWLTSNQHSQDCDSESHVGKYWYSINNTYDGSHPEQMLRLVNYFDSLTDSPLPYTHIDVDVFTDPIFFLLI